MKRNSNPRRAWRKARHIRRYERWCTRVLEQAFGKRAKR